MRKAVATRWTGELPTSPLLGASDSSGVPWGDGYLSDIDASGPARCRRAMRAASVCTLESELPNHEGRASWSLSSSSHDGSGSGSSSTRSPALSVGSGSSGASVSSDSGDDDEPLEGGEEGAASGGVAAAELDAQWPPSAAAALLRRAQGVASRSSWGQSYAIADAAYRDAATRAGGRVA